MSFPAGEEPPAVPGAVLENTGQQAGSVGHIFAAVAPAPTDRAGSGPVARVGRSYQEYPLIKDCCYKPKVFCMLICKRAMHIM